MKESHKQIIEEIRKDYGFVNITSKTIEKMIGKVWKKKPNWNY